MKNLLYKTKILWFESKHKNFSKGSQSRYISFPNLSLDINYPIVSNPDFNKFSGPLVNKMILHYQQDKKMCKKIVEHYLQKDVKIIQSSCNLNNWINSQSGLLDHLIALDIPLKDDDFFSIFQMSNFYEKKNFLKNMARPEKECSSHLFEKALTIYAQEFDKTNIEFDKYGSTINDSSFLGKATYFELTDMLFFEPRNIKIIQIHKNLNEPSVLKALFISPKFSYFLLSSLQKEIQYILSYGNNCSVSKIEDNEKIYEWQDFTFKPVENMLFEPENQPYFIQYFLKASFFRKNGLDVFSPDFEEKMAKTIFKEIKNNKNYLLSQEKDNISPNLMPYFEELLIMLEKMALDQELSKIITPQIKETVKNNNYKI